MQRFLDWIDESASNLIRLAYLVAGITAVATYFASGIVSNAATQFLNDALPWVLAAAVETHSYISARRVRSNWQQLQATAEGSNEHEQAMRGLKVNLGILALLLAFSVYNQLEYLASTWTPPHTALALPDPLAYAVRALITPLAFLAAAFLAPMGASLTAQVKAEAHRVAGETFKVARIQWKQRLAKMRQEGADVTAALVQLVEDPDERRVIATIHAAMYGVAPEPFPTGGGSPVASSDAPLELPHDSTREAVTNGRVVHLPPRVTQRVVASRRKAHPRAVRTVDTWEPQARQAWANGARTVTPMMAATGMTRPTASKWVRVLKAESQPLQRGNVAL